MGVPDLGGFAQWQSINGGEHQRVCFGLQATFIALGIEAGVAHDFAGVKGVATTSVHLAPFLSLGFVSVGLRVGVPVATGPGDKPGYGRDVGLVLSLKLPLRLTEPSEE